MPTKADIAFALKTALPIMLGYVAIGIPCGILCESVGVTAPQALMLSLVYYSGAGQFMIPNMWLAGSSVASIVLSVSMVNTRQMLYSAALAPACKDTPRPLAFLFAATVTDESYGVNTAMIERGEWTAVRGSALNVFCCLSWSLSNAVGVLVGDALGIPLAIASFAMTSIFICLLVTQKVTVENVVAAAVAMVGVFAAKTAGLSGLAIVIGAVAGVVAAMLCERARRRG